MRPLRVLDLFCGAGGASEGYRYLGYEIVGVDVKAQRRYPYEFYQADAMTFPLTGFDLIHASPPCQDHSRLSSRSPEHGTGWMLEATIERLEASGLHFIVENVPDARPRMGEVVQLCGSSFGLGVRRHRLFRSNLPLLGSVCNHVGQGQPVGCYGHGGGKDRGRGNKGTVSECAEAMGIDWMTGPEMAQAIPPAYTEYLGKQVRKYLRESN